MKPSSEIIAHIVNLQILLLEKKLAILEGGYVAAVALEKNSKICYTSGVLSILHINWKGKRKTYSIKTLLPTLLAAFLMFAPQLARAQDASAGRDYFLRECIRCHTFECNKDGPQLAGLVGRTIGSVEDYGDYSQNFVDADFVWTVDLLDAFFAAPAEMFPDSPKAWDGPIEDVDIRQNLIAFLQTEDPAVNLCF